MSLKSVNWFQNLKRRNTDTQTQRKHSDLISLMKEENGLKSYENDNTICENGTTKTTLIQQNKFG